MKQDSSPPEAPEAIIKSIQWLLKPLVKLLIHYKITLPQLIQWLKIIYVEIAENEFSLPNKEQTDSRISMLTGVHRKDVRSIRHETKALPQQAPGSLSAQILARWLGDSHYLTKGGKPRALPFEPQADSSPSFTDLVAEVSRQDIRARVMLDEWLAAGIVSINSKQHIHLNMDNIIPSEDFNEQAKFYGRILHDHISTSSDNLIKNDAPLFDRYIYYNNLTPKSVATLKSLVEKQGMTLLEKVNRKARELQINDRDQANHSQRFSTGLYFFQEKQPNSEQDSHNDER